MTHVLLTMNNMRFISMHFNTNDFLIQSLWEIGNANDGSYKTELGSQKDIHLRCLPHKLNTCEQVGYGAFSGFKKN